MSTRRTRQELIEQGVLKEVPDNGKSLWALSVSGPRLSHPRTVESGHQHVMAGTLLSQTAGG